MLPIVGIICATAGCDRTPPKPPGDPRQLVAAIRESPTTYVRDANGKPGGFEYDLLAEFANSAGLTLTPLVLPSDLDMYQALRDGKVRLAIGWLSAPREGAGRFRLTRPYASSRMALVQHEASLPIESLAQLGDRPIHVAAGSQLAERLYHLRQSKPEIRIIERPDPSGMDLLRAVAERRIDLAVSETAVVDIAENFFPELDAAMLLGDAHGASWLFPAEGDDALFASAQAFLRQAETDGTLARLKDRYFGHIDRLTPASTIEFLALTRTVLPRFHALFKQAQIRTGIDWRLLAALGYQESKWDPLATSPTNVRGMMMLTEDTADRLRVSDRLDAKQSILAGAAYLAELRDQLPASIAEPDRTWMALAAYNLGMGHLNGARHIARGMKTGVDHWHEMKRVLPLMSRPEYYGRLKSGRARGGEAVIMVENIRAYYDILQRHLPAYTPLSARHDAVSGEHGRASGGTGAPGPGAAAISAWQ